MGAIRVHEFMSLDGVIDAPTWTFDYGFDPNMGRAIAAAMDGCEGILLGRTTYEMFEPAWSQRTVEDDPGAPFFNDSMKYVVSGTLTSTTWRNSQILGPYQTDAIPYVEGHHRGRSVRQRQRHARASDALRRIGRCLARVHLSADTRCRAATLHRGHDSAKDDARCERVLRQRRRVSRVRIAELVSSGRRRVRLERHVQTEPCSNAGLSREPANVYAGVTAGTPSMGASASSSRDPVLKPQTVQ